MPAYSGGGLDMTSKKEIDLLAEKVERLSTSALVMPAIRELVADLFAVLQIQNAKIEAAAGAVRENEDSILVIGEYVLNLRNEFVVGTEGRMERESCLKP